MPRPVVIPEYPTYLDIMASEPLLPSFPFLRDEDFLAACECVVAAYHESASSSVQGPDQDWRSVCLRQEVVALFASSWEWVYVD